MSIHYDDESMKKLDMRLGEGHRVRPYDLTNAADLNQALLVAVAAYRDYWHYRNVMLETYEDFDETLEYVDTESWLNLDKYPHDVDDLVSQCDSSLNIVIEHFSILADRAKSNCVKVLRAALKARPATQKKVLGQAYRLDPNEMDEKIEDLFEMLDEEDYFRAMPDNLLAFQNLMKEMWGTEKE
ncbi:MAG: hypothetical protein LBC41_01040 [Clostridiales bacterium]|jgi:hypothetical protein|nr:hypothetical protein [Clostridiales bacterium]MDR2749219.1 hypothetical protein [Clostridiales bacterium]